MKSDADTLMNLLILLVFFVGIAAWWMVKHGNTGARIGERTRMAAYDQRTDNAVADIDNESDGEPTLRRKLFRRLAVFGDKMPLFDAKTRAALQITVMRAGFRSRHATSAMLAIKFGFGLIAAVSALFMGNHLPFVGQFPLARGVAMLAAFILGMIVPEYVVMWRGSRRMSYIAAYLPDALDLLIICTNAGNSFVVSLRRVADELSQICPPLSDELSLTADELKLSGDTTNALYALGRRVDLPPVKALIGTLVQSMRYGTPITQALKTLSRAERLTHMVNLEEKAAKLAPKMVLPMMLFILPAVVMISAGPSVIQLLAFINSQR